MESHKLGIDISKKTFDVALLREGKFKHKKLRNSAAGFKELSLWLERLNVASLHACMESTGSYGEALAQYLYDAGYQVSIVNPARIKGFAQGELIRTKTDKSDASLIARFCLAMAPSLWTPEPWEIRLLRDLSRRYDSLLEMRQQEVNRLDVSGSELRCDIEEHIKYLDNSIAETKKRIRDHIDDHPDLKRKKDLLETIPGVGEATINVVLSEFADISRFDSAKQLASFIGLAPRHRLSGTSVRGRASMSKIGNAKVRKSFFMPALVAMKFNPVLIEMRRRLLKAGKPKMLIVGAVMRKLIHIIYGVLKNNQPFNPDFQVKNV
ncbi:IS110 family transposase [Mariprofundus sp. NF]|uniref:IS110 family transposase n=1 Tax=Mariprofundus sp. NF TaxID=2608716 RepID=UPI0015A08BDC|nr:IS110 family transposase [Mariprofundus sp. NF]NWF39896.1 IS110 family transposase [Mariprofundus sp. NF]